jgi:hypothetical protein
MLNATTRPATPSIADAEPDAESAGSTVAVCNREAPVVDEATTDAPKA